SSRAILRVVERLDRIVEPTRDLFGDRFGIFRSRQQNEIVPADVPDEALIGAGGVYEDLREHRDNAVAAREPVVVVEFLEPVDVDIEEREVLTTRETRFELLGDRRIAGQTRQRVDVPQSAPPSHRRADARKQLVGVVRLGDEVFGARLQLGELGLAVGLSGEKYDRQ